MKRRYYSILAWLIDKLDNVQRFCIMILRVTYTNKEGQMTKQDTIRELEQRLGREIAIEYFKNENRVVSEEEAELEDYTGFSFEVNTEESIIL